MSNRSSLWIAVHPEYEAEVIALNGSPNSRDGHIPGLTAPAMLWDEATSQEAESVLRTLDLSGVVVWGNHGAYDGGATVFHAGEERSLTLGVEGDYLVPVYRDGVSPAGLHEAERFFVLLARVESVLAHAEEGLR